MGVDFYKIYISRRRVVRNVQDVQVDTSIYFCSTIQVVEFSIHNFCRECVL